MRLSRLTHYVVYKHTSTEGAAYIGEGNNLRAEDFKNRTASWKAAFNKDTVTVEILGIYSTKAGAQLAEAIEIERIGIDSLINSVNTHKSLLTKDSSA